MPDRVRQRYNITENPQAKVAEILAQMPVRSKEIAMREYLFVAQTLPMSGKFYLLSVFRKTTSKHSIDLIFNE